MTPLTTCWRLVQLFDKLRHRYNGAHGVQPQPRYGVGDGADDMLGAVGDTVGDLQDLADESGVATDEMGQLISARRATRQTQNFLAGSFKGW